MKVNFGNLFENPHEEVEKMNSAQLREAQLTRVLNKELAQGQAPYSDSRRSLYRVAGLFSWLSNGYSFLTGGFTGAYLLHLQLGFMPTGWALATAITGGAATALLLETAKRSANNRFFFEVVFIKRLKSGAWAAVLFTAVVSISASFYAATKIPKAVANSPELVNLDSIQSQYHQMIAGKTALIKEVTDKGTWKGTLTRVNQQTLLELQRNVQTLEAKQDSSLAAAQLENSNRLLLAEATHSNNGQLLGWMTLISELLFMGCFWYRKRYHYKAAAERNFLRNGNDPKANIDGGFTAINPTNIGRSTIGFQVPHNSGHNSANTSVITGDRIADVVFIKNTVTHIDQTNGKAKEMTVDEIQKYINTYKGRVDNTLDKLTDGVMGANEYQKSANTLRDRLTKLLYWHEKKGELVDEWQKYQQHIGKPK